MNRRERRIRGWFTVDREVVEPEDFAQGIHTKNERRRNEILLEAIDETLRELFSTDIREQLYDNLEKNDFLTREDLPTHLYQFSSALRKYFGVAGPIVERRIAKKFCAMTGKEFYDNCHMLSPIVAYARLDAQV